MFTVRKLYVISWPDPVVLALPVKLEKLSSLLILYYDHPRPRHRHRHRHCLLVSYCITMSIFQIQGAPHHCGNAHVHAFSPQQRAT